MNKQLPPGGYTGPPDTGPSLRDYAAALKRRYWLILVLALIGMGSAAYVAYKSEPLYSSNTVLQLEEERAAPSGGLAGLAASLGGGGGTVQAQIQLIRSRLLAGVVVDSLGLRLQREVNDRLRTTHQPTAIVREVQIPDHVPPMELRFRFGSVVKVQGGGERVEAAYGAPIAIGGLRFTVPQHPGRDELTMHVVPRDQAINRLLRSIRVFSRDGTNVLDIVVTGYDSAITQQIADVTAEVYRQYTSQRARESAEQRRRFVWEQLETAEQLLLETQEELTAYRQRERLYSSIAEAGMATTGRAELEMRRAELDAQLRVHDSLLRTLERGGDINTVLQMAAASPSTLNNPGTQLLYEQLSMQQMRRDSLRSGPYRRSVDDPDVVALDSIIAATQTRLLANTRSQVETLRAQLSAMDMIRMRTDSLMAHIAVTEPEEVRLVLRMEAIGEAAKELRERYYTAGMLEAGATDRVTVLDRALPGDPSGAGLFRSLLLGLVFGLMVGSAGAIAWDQMKRSIRRRDELEGVLQVRGLGVIPQLPGGNGRKMLPGARHPLPNGGPTSRGRLVATSRIPSAGTEAFRMLGTNLILSQPVESLRSLVVTSAVPGEGKTTTAANLAVAFAQRGQRILLVDGDLRRAELHGIFGVSRDPGLADLLLGTGEEGACIRETDVPGLSLLPAGTVPLEALTDPIASGALRPLLDGLQQRFDLVLVDAPPVMVTANATILATHADGVVVVVRADHSRPEIAREAIQQLTAVGANVVGAVLNDADPPVDDGGYYESGSGSAYATR
jgi:capsular exopolysaccharide synthesis family protein